MCYFNQATGENSFSTGQDNIAQGLSSSVFGRLNKSIGYVSTTFGFNNKTRSDIASSFGTELINRSFLAFTLGQFNDTTNMTNLVSWTDTDPLFVIGKGTSNAARSNAVTILKNAKTGINLTNPQSMLHVRSVTSGGPFNSNAVAIFEGDQGSFIQLSNANTIQSGILSGNALTAIRSALIFSADSAMFFRTGGNTSRAVLTKNGDLGVGDLTPDARLHVSEGGGGGLYFTEAEMVIEDNANAYVQLSTPTASESGILSGNALTSIRSAIIFRSDSSVHIRAGGNTSRMAITETGNIGIGTTAPAAKLDVEGTTILGTNGTTINEVIKLTVANDVSSIAAGGSLNVDFAVANAALNSSVYVSPQNDLPNGMIIAYARVQSSGVVRARFTNISTGPIDLANMNYYITVIR